MNLSDLKMRVWEILDEREPGKWVFGTVNREFLEALNDEFTAEAIAEVMLARANANRVRSLLRRS